jgi:outer membrane receptor for ferrienterochelin and colicin
MFVRFIKNQKNILFLGFLFLSQGVLSEQALSNQEQKITDLSLFELGQLTVRSTSFYDQSLQQTLGSVVILDQQKINHSSSTNLADFLQYQVPGFHVGASEQYGPTVGVRGVQKSINSEVLVMRNGQSLNRHNFSGYTGGYLLPLLGDLQQIEISKGPGAIVHGSGADAGFINLVPKNGSDFNGLFANLSYGFVDDQKRLETGYGKRLGKDHDLYLYGGVVQADGYHFNDDFGASNSTEFSGVRRITNLNVGGFPLPSYKFSTYYRYQDFSFSGLFKRINIHPNSFIVRYDDDSAWHETVLALNPRYRLHLGQQETLEFNTSFEFFDFGIENRDNPTAAGFIGDEGGSEAHQEVKLILTSTRFEGHKIALGGLFGHRVFEQGEQFFSSNPDNAHFSATDTNWNEYAIFAEDIIQLNQSTSLTLGGRSDWIDYSDIGSPLLGDKTDSFPVSDIHEFTGRAILTHRIDALSNLKIAYQKGFHYPDTAQFVENRLFSNELHMLGAAELPDIKPETISSFEINYQRLFINQHLETNLTFYYNQHKDSLLFFNLRTPNNFYSQADINTIVKKFGYFGAFQNSPQDFDATGVELSLDWKPDVSFEVNLSYAFSQPVNVENNANVISSGGLVSQDRDDWLAFPKHQLKGSMLYKISPNWDINITGIYESAVDIEAPETEQHQGINSSYVRINALLEYHHTPQSTFFLLAKNIFANDTPPVSFINYRPFNGNLGSDESLVYFGYRYEY